MFMNRPTVIFGVSACLFGCGGPCFTPAECLKEDLATISSNAPMKDRFAALTEAAKNSFVLGRTNDARTYATEALTLAPSLKGNWNYGNAIHDGNMVLGRIALSEGRKTEAIRYLHAAGDTPGSPQLATFGPNMSLAKDLLEHGERDVVLEYFEQCRKFWKNGGPKLYVWTLDVKNGAMPHFDSQLTY